MLFFGGGGRGGCMSGLHKFTSSTLELLYSNGQLFLMMTPLLTSPLKEALIHMDSLRCIYSLGSNFARDVEML